MHCTPRESDQWYDLLEPLVRGMGMDLIELTVSRIKPSEKGKKNHRAAGDTKAASRAQIRLVVYKRGIIGINDCSRIHHAILPRLELALPNTELFVEVSSPGISRLIKDGSEFAYYIGSGVRCYRIEASDWVRGILTSATAEGIQLKTLEGMLELPFSSIGKAKLDTIQED